MVGITCTCWCVGVMERSFIMGISENLYAALCSFHALKLHLMEGQTFISKGCRYKEPSSLHSVYKVKKSKMVR